jgi:hypothetical protein
MLKLDIHSTVQASCMTAGSPRTDYLAGVDTSKHEISGGRRCRGQVHLHPDFLV